MRERLLDHDFIQCDETPFQVLNEPGKPAQNAFIERFNQTYRTEVLDAHVFQSLHEARLITTDWLRRYNTERPHDSLGRVPPLTFLPRPTSVGEYHLELSA